MVLGRDAELGRLDALLSGLSGGRGFAVVMRGEPGVGKSALLDELAGRPGAGQVLRVCGTPSESEVAFSGLSELAQPLLASLAALPLGSARSCGRFWPSRRAPTTAGWPCSSR